MTAKASYPNPFTGAAISAAPICDATIGPCWSSKATIRQDISDGQDGLPMRMYLQVVDAKHAPVSGAMVDVWHVAATGKYSGNDEANEQIDMCTDNDPAYTSSLWFRGKQITDDKGHVYFDTCFPGWYQSRTVHVHFIITVAGTSTLTSQLVFDDALDDEIIATQPIYKARGARDTTNKNDNVVPADKLDTYTFSTQRMSDGAMLAYKTIAIPTRMCSLGGPGFGHPPPPRDDLLPIF